MNSNHKMWSQSDIDLSQAFDESESFGNHTSPPPLSTHCNVPLKYNKQRAAINKPSYGQHSLPKNRYWREFQFIQELSGSINPTYYDLCHVQYDLLNIYCPTSNTLIMAEWNQQLRISTHMWRDQSIALISLLSQTISLPDYALNEDQLSILKPYYLRKTFIEEGVLSSGSTSYQPIYWWKKKNNNVSYYKDYSLFMASTSNLFFIIYEGKSYLTSRDHLLVLSDLAAQRYLLIKYSLLSTHHPQPPFVPPGLLIEFLEKGDVILKYGGNDSYKIISNIEPLCLSYLVGDLPVGTRSGRSFKELIRNEISNYAIELEIIDETNELVSVIEVANNISPSYLTELYGLYRIWGHPTLEPLEGATALKKIATKVRATTQDLVDNINNKFKEEFICRYIAKEHIWPDLDLSLLPVSNVIHQAYLRKASFPNKHKDYKRSHLNLIKFKQLFPVDPKFDLIELIADKALSLITPELISEVTRNHNCGLATQRSVLLNWLRSPIQDPEKFLKWIDQNGFPEFEKSNGIREKEREEKLRPRMFGLMTLFKRMYIVLTEALLAEHIIPYFPEITMIDDELSLDKKRFMFNLKTEEVDQIIVSLDFSKWNTNMRKNETLSLFRSFDQMFGFKQCFSLTHDMFENSAIYLLNGTYLPKVKDYNSLKQDIGCWYGHLGGIEGLRQKGWTIWTVSLILLASENLNFSLALMGQGDNQILRLRFPLGCDTTESEETMYKFLSNLNIILEKVGPPLKLEETWASRDLYVYGKYIIYKGIPLPTSGKRIARIFRLSNEDYPTLESALSSATANLTAALSCHYCIGPLFVLYLAEIISTFQLSLRSCYLQKIPLCNVFSTLSSIKIPGNPTIFKDVSPVTNPSGIQKDIFYESICLFPRALGGFPILTIFDCLLRGFPDEVTFAISSLKRIYTYTHRPLQLMIERMCSPPIHDQKNYQLIAEHPTVLNLEVPPAPGESRRNLIINFLRSGDIVLNQYVKTFMDILDSEEDQIILRYLTTTKPFNPRIISLFMAATVESRARHVAGKLQKTKTIANVARNIGHIDLYSKIMDAEKNHFGSVLRLLYENHPNTVPWDSNKCSTKHSDDLRLLSWGSEVIGVNCVPPQEFMAIELNLIDNFCDNQYELSKGYVAIRLESNFLLESFNSPFIKGPYPPYRGYVTRQKVSGYGDKIAAQSEPIIQKVLRLYSLVGWGIKKDGNLHELCNRLLERHTDLPNENLCPPDEEISGSVHHRLQDMRTGHGGSVPTLPNYGTKIMFDTFPLISYSKGSKNVNLMFQSFMSASTVLLGELISHNYKFKKPVIHLHVSNSCCVQEITEEFCESPIPPFFVLTKYIDNPYLYVKQEKILLMMEKGLRFEINRNLGPDAHSLFHRFHSLLSEECFHLLSPHNWDRFSFGFKTQQLVINWVLPCNISILLHSLSLRLVTHYLGAIREKDAKSFLKRVSERVERSPMDHWKSLSALIFAPDIHHHIVGKGIFSKTSGSPLCSETTLALMIKEATVAIITHWSNEETTIKSLMHVDCYGRPYCGLSQHPSLLLLCKDWMLNKVDQDILIDSRYAIINQLTNKPLETHNKKVTKIKDHYINLGKKRITGESLDYLCKRDNLLYPCYIKPKAQFSSFPIGGDVILIFNRNNLHRTKHTLTKELLYTKSVTYENHLMKIAATPTTGTYKCLSILNTIKLINPKYVACMGDGGGGFTLGSLLYLPKVNVFYNTLILHGVPIQQSSPIPFIPSLAGHKDLETRIVGLDITTDIISDLTDKNLGNVIKSRISNQFDLIMCDAEFTKQDDPQKGLDLLLGTLRTSLILSSNVLVFKSYLKNISLISLQISILLSRYSSVKIFRSHFSSTYNTEVYLIAEDLGVKENITEISHYLWEGSILKPGSFEQLYQWRDYLLTTPLLDISEISKIYTSIISPDSRESFITELRMYLPFISLKNTNYYPSDIIKWIHNTSSEWTGAPLITRIRLETTTLHHTYLRRWALSLLISYLLTNIEKISPIILDIINNGSLVWFRLNNKSWDISLYYGSEEIDSKYSGVKIYKLINILSDGDKKLIYRIAGVALHLNIKFETTNHEKNTITRGHLTWNHNPISIPQEAETQWIRGNLQYGTICRAPEKHQLIKKPRPIILRKTKN